MREKIEARIELLELNSLKWVDENFEHPFQQEIKFLRSLLSDLGGKEKET